MAGMRSGGRGDRLPPRSALDGLQMRATEVAGQLDSHVRGTGEHDERTPVRGRARRSRENDGSEDEAGAHGNLQA